MRYEVIPDFDGADLEKTLKRGDLNELRLIALSFALNSDEPKPAEALCLYLASHEDQIVRGNAIPGLGHIGRIHGTLTEPSVKTVVERALRDSDERVRGQAESAADDIEQFLKWKLERP